MRRSDGVLVGRHVVFDGGLRALVLDAFPRQSFTRYGDPGTQYCLVVEILSGPALPPGSVGRIEIVPLGPGVSATLEQTEPHKPERCEVDGCPGVDGDGCVHTSGAA